MLTEISCHINGNAFKQFHYATRNTSVEYGYITGITLC